MTVIRERQISQDRIPHNQIPHQRTPNHRRMPSSTVTGGGTQTVGAFRSWLDAQETSATPSPGLPSPGTQGSGSPLADTDRAEQGSRQRRATFLRRRVTVVAGLVVAVFVLGMVVGRVGASADLEQSTVGHDVVAPGETLWDVAVRTAPGDTDTRRHLEHLREVNGIESSHVDAWTVVAIPTR